MDLHKKINNFIKKLNKSSLKIIVFGDSIIDEYYNVTSNRISPEFPIPVSLTSSDQPIEVLPGGAGNVCRQYLNYSNIKIMFYSLLDEFAEIQYKKNKIDTQNCIIIPGRVPRKKRFYNNHFPLFRWDVEEKDFGINNISYYQNKLFEKLSNSEADACIFSDYSKGVFSDDINYKYNFSIIDPKKDPIKKWYDCSIFKPNKIEATSLTNTTSPIEQCKFLKKKLNCKNILITDSYKGFYGVDEENNFFNYDSGKEESVVSVVGGGDCFVAYLTLAVLLGFNIHEAAEISFNISYFYVTNNKNNNMSYLDLYNILNKKIIDKDFLNDRNFKLVFTNGCFDAGLTPGHIDCLRFAKNQGGKLVVALNSDESIKRIKGENRPLMSLEERMEIISSIEFVDYVLSFDEDTPINLIKYLKPDIIVKGGDYKSCDVIGADVSKVLICPKRNCISTTEKLKYI
jgi:D-beta-D-heptose 7-phosphate kinase/D-beta-D-heptose 1-phosphate adenosyltransferase